MWEKVAEGRGLGDLNAVVPEQELKKGDRIRVVMDLKVPVAWAFDLAPNWGWPAPEGTFVVDIWGEGASTGVVELEVDPPLPLIAGLITFLRLHWVAILIAGAMLGAIITSIVVFKWVIEAGGRSVALLVIAGSAVAIIGVVLLTTKRRRTLTS